MPNRLPYSLADLTNLLGIALLYPLLAKIALGYVAINGIAILWPSSGLALAALLTFGIRLWPGVLVGAFAAELMMDFPLWAVSLTALGNTLEPVAGVWLLSRFGFDKSIPTLKDYFLLLILGTFASTAVSAVIGSSMTVLTGITPVNELPAAFFRWWMGNMLGTLLAVPLLVKRISVRHDQARHIGEAILLLLATACFCAVVFHDYGQGFVNQIAKAYWAFPLIIWAAMRFGIQGVSSLLLMIHGLSLLGVVRGTGYFGQDMQETGLFNFWLYQVILSVAGMTLASGLDESYAARAALEQERHRLRESEIRLREYLEFSPVPLSVSETGTQRVVFVNRVFTELFGYTLGDLPWLSEWLQKAHPDPAYRQKILAEWFGPLMEDGICPQPNYEARIVCKDGSERIVTLVASPSADHLLIAFNDMTEHRQAKELIWRQAHYDALTDLPNRRLFLECLANGMALSRRAKLGLALLLIDLDRFKEVNDTFGHDVGDQLLANVARRIVSCVGTDDTVARLGGDEFTVALPNIANPTQAGQIAQTIVRTLAEPFQLGHEQVFVSASIGVTCYPDDGNDPKTLLKNADLALFETKALGRNGFSYFTQTLQEATQRRLSIIRDLREALANGQFSVHYQPIVDLRDGHIVKAEALLRWHHPTQGLIAPSSFIEVAEDIGLINEIGDWVFHQAARQAKHCANQGLPIQISVNKSARQFWTGHDRQDWVGYLAQIGLPTKLIAIEITENILLDDRPEMLDKLRRFRDAGIEICIDDFGTGYSSLSYLKKFDIDTLKIDRAFIRDLTSDPSDLALAEAIIVMAHKLGLKVVAEGVETLEQQDLLAASQCDFAQGFLYAKALPSNEFDALLAGWKKPETAA